ncbi:MAG TPA: xanthine dehydrogenase family protein molybdopterin-binding subunit [Streptosporangiaceae bacterium]
MTTYRDQPRSIRRLEARRLVGGGGRYVDDLSFPGALHVVFVRSPHPHARVLGIDAAPAQSLEGIVGVFTLGDLLRMGARRLPIGWAVPGQHGPANDLLAADRVRYVGDPVAAVVGEDRYLAEDGAAAVAVDYEPLPAVADVEHALRAGAPLLHPDWGENIIVSVQVGSGDVGSRFAAAEVVVRDRFHLGRAMGMPLEPRGAVASIDAWTDEIVLRSSTQAPHHARQYIAEATGRPERTIRVVAPDVGGSFGVKDHACAEEVVVCLLAAFLRRPVKWIEDRREHLAAGVHSREQVLEVELAGRADGSFEAMRGELWLDAGAYCGNHGIGTALYTASVLPGPYRLGAYSLQVTGVVTNKTPSAAYRGYGAPEAAFVMEGLVDRFAEAVRRDPAEIRRQNFVPPDAFPYRSASGCTYDKMDYREILDRALATADYAGLRRSSPEEGPEERSGVGIACSMLMGGFGPSRAAVEAGMDFGGYETVQVRMDRDGKAEVLTGMSGQGQGIETALAQICADSLGLDPLTDVAVTSGDTARTPFSPVGAIASRGAAVGGEAVRRAADELARGLRRVAAEMLGTRTEEVRLTAGRAWVNGTGASVAISAVAARARLGSADGDRSEVPLEGVATYEPAAETYSFAVHVAVVGVQPRTGVVRIRRYVTVSDCGRLINPGFVAGQIEGGVMQGIGGALFEEAAYDENGRFLTPTLFEYLIPTMMDAPEVEVELVETPTPLTVTGARGAGELGIIAPAAALANAIGDALGPGASRPRETPLTPYRVWLLAAASSSTAGNGPSIHGAGGSAQG